MAVVVMSEAFGCGLILSVPFAQRRLDLNVTENH